MIGHVTKIRFYNYDYCVEIKRESIYAQHWQIKINRKVRGEKFNQHKIKIGAKSYWKSINVYAEWLIKCKKCSISHKYLNLNETNIFLTDNFFIQSLFICFYSAAIFILLLICNFKTVYFVTVFYSTFKEEYWRINKIVKCVYDYLKQAI